MKENRLLKIWESNRPAFNGWLTLPEPLVAENMALAGWDSVTVDMQHGIQDFTSCVNLLRGIALSNAVPLVRVPWLEEGMIMRVLDAGAMGVICPMIDNAEQAQRFVNACLYPPAGARSFGPIRAKPLYGEDYVHQANGQILPIAMIETKTALDNLDSILSVEHLKGIYIGPSDLAISLGIEQRYDSDDPVLNEAINRILQTAKKQGVKACIHNSSATHALKMADMGFDLVTAGSDIGYIVRSAAADLRELRGYHSHESTSPY